MRLAFEMACVVAAVAGVVMLWGVAVGLIVAGVGGLALSWVTA